MPYFKSLSKYSVIYTQISQTLSSLPSLWIGSDNNQGLYSTDLYLGIIVTGRWVDPSCGQRIIANVYLQINEL